MPETIFQVDPTTRKAIAVQPVSFADIGIKERADLQQWILHHPEILGEPLLVVATEFASFDRSAKRLDILALDQAGTLTIVELKLAAIGSHADLQAIRYAAFCSTMTMPQAVRSLAQFCGCSPKDAEAAICEFLEKDELPKLDRQPRIILAAGSMDDQELTGAVLWLRRFGVDISCVELTPYRMPGSGSPIVLVPRIVIPVPEARDFMIMVEQKEASENQDEKAASVYVPLWTAVVAAFNAQQVMVNGRPFVADRVFRGPYQQVTSGLKGIHYEWYVRHRAKCLDVCVHFEAADEAVNKRMVAPLLSLGPALSEGVPEDLVMGNFGDQVASTKYREARYRIRSDSPTSPELASRAAELMKILIERTYPTLVKEAQTLA